VTQKVSGGEENKTEPGEETGKEEKFFSISDKNAEQTD